jgi:ABC-type transport system involved in cytochrome c biogenesis permease subunit
LPSAWASGGRPIGGACAGWDYSWSQPAWLGFPTIRYSPAIRGIEENHTPWAGGFERINAYAYFAWLVVLAVTVTRRSLNQVPPEKGVAEVAQTRAPSIVASG